jgi:NitT/TauT family transport system ATP-binding protein
VLTAETLRGELLELWQGKKIPTRAIFIVTHNIEEAVILADRIIVLGRNPAHIHAEFNVELAHPRDHKDPRFVELVDLIYRALTRQDHAGHTATGLPGTEGIARKTQLMLPHTRPGGLAGLLEILVDQGGRADLHVLADELSLEVDALLPSVDTAVLLGMLKLEEGDALITPEGLAFAQGDIQERKAIFRKAALTNIPLFRQMEQSLKAKADRTLPAEFFQDLLDEHFSEDEARRQLETAIQWGRYAEIFVYDAASGKLTLTET